MNSEKNGKQQYVFPIVSFVFALIFSFGYNYLIWDLHRYYFFHSYEDPSDPFTKLLWICVGNSFDAHLLISYVVPVTCFLLYFFFRKMNWRNMVIMLLMLAYSILAFLVIRYGFHNIVKDGIDSNLDDIYVGTFEYNMYLWLSYAPYMVWAFVDFVIHVVASTFQKKLWFRNGIISLSLVMCIVLPITLEIPLMDIFDGYQYTTIPAILGILVLSILSVLILGGRKDKLSLVRLLSFILCVTIMLSIPYILYSVIALLLFLCLIALFIPIVICVIIYFAAKSTRKVKKSD